MRKVRRWSVRHARGVERFFAAWKLGLTVGRPAVRAVGYRRLERPVAFAEHRVKGLLFDCRMCGDCLLSSTGMSCPMNCPKGIRNGPCGGVRPDGACEVLPEMTCVWVDAWEGARRMKAGALPTTPNRPAEANLSGRSTWLSMVGGDPPPEVGPALAAVRPPPTGGRLEAVLRAGEFAVTAELDPPDSADPADVYSRLDVFDGVVDAINVTDAAGASCHMSSLAVSALLVRAGREPIFQMATRDRNRIALQGDILGAAALGIVNLFCVTGDRVQRGDQPGAKPVFDLDSVTLLSTARRLRDEGVFRSGRPISSPPRLFLGAAENPFAPPFELRASRLAQKVAAGAQFIQTQYCWDVPLFARFMERVRDLGLHERCHILVGVGPLGSARAARYMRDNVPGVHVPDAVIERLERAADPAAEGTRICLETIAQVREIAGVAGIHLMAYRHERLIPEIVAESGILAGRRLPPSPPAASGAVSVS